MTTLEVLRAAARYYDASSHEKGANEAVSAVEQLERAARHIVYPFDFDPNEMLIDWHGSELAGALVPFNPKVEA